MSNKKTEGLIAAPVAVYKQDGTVNLNIIPKIAAFLHANGVVGAFVNGTTGEGFSLTVEERKAIAERWVESAPKGFKIIIHVAHTSAPASWEMASHAAKIGASAVSEMAPLFFKPKSVKELVANSARTAAKANGLPYYYYHMPAMSGVNFPMIDFLKLADSAIPNLAGLKYTHSDLMDFASCLEYKEGKYDILYGRDETLLCALSLGCKGAVGSTYNIMAPLYNKIISAFNAGDINEAQRLQQISIKAIELLENTGNFFSALKEAMKMIGLDTGGVRPPLEDNPPEINAGLRKNLNKLDFSDFCSKVPAD